VYPRHSCWWKAHLLATITRPNHSYQPQRQTTPHRTGSRVSAPSPRRSPAGSTLSSGTSHSSWEGGSWPKGCAAVYLWRCAACRVGARVSDRHPYLSIDPFAAAPRSSHAPLPTLHRHPPPHITARSPPVSHSPTGLGPGLHAGPLGGHLLGRRLPRVHHQQGVSVRDGEKRLSIPGMLSWSWLLGLRGFACVALALVERWWASLSRFDGLAASLVIVTTCCCFCCQPLLPFGCCYCCFDPSRPTAVCRCFDRPLPPSPFSPKPRPSDSKSFEHDNYRISRAKPNSVIEVAPTCCKRCCCGVHSACDGLMRNGRQEPVGGLNTGIGPLLKRPAALRCKTHVKRAHACMRHNNCYAVLLVVCIKQML